MTSVLDQDRLLDADPVGNLDRYQARLVLSDLAAGRIYELSRRAILAHRLSPAERTICDGTTLSLRLDIGDTGIEISFDHSMRPPDEVLELVASLDGELPEKHRLGRGGYALEGRRAGPR